MKAAEVKFQSSLTFFGYQIYQPQGNMKSGFLISRFSLSVPNYLPLRSG